MSVTAVQFLVPRLFLRHGAKGTQNIVQRYFIPKVKLLSTLHKHRPACLPALSGDYRNSQINQVRCISEEYLEHLPPEMVSRHSTSLVQRVQRNLGYKGGLTATPKRLSMSGTQLYHCVVQLVHPSVEDFISDLEMADTFNSWFRITQLHVWMIMVRLIQEGPEGIYVRNQILTQMWDDVKERVKALKVIKGRTEFIGAYSDAFWTAVISYDEGLLGDDKMLASALWNIFFDKEDINPKHLEFMVGYVRKQIHYLDSQDSRSIVERGVITFLPMYGDRLDTENIVVKQILSIASLNKKSTV